MKIESEVHHELTQLGEHARQAQVRHCRRGDQQCGQLAGRSMRTMTSHLHTDTTQALDMSADQLDAAVGKSHQTALCRRT
jgi:hypothetical protein